MLEGKVAVVTGGTRGIGLETVRTFLKNKAKVVLLGSKEETVSKALEELKQENESYEVIGFYPNLINQEEVESCFEKVKQTFGKIDILINNAGISSKTKITDFTEEEYDKITNINISELGDYDISVSMGVAFNLAVNNQSFEKIYKNADSCVYDSKKKEGNVYTFY